MMKVHPLPKKRSLTFSYNSTETQRLMSRQKKLHRLPHIFSKVLELPFRSDTDVMVEETSSCFRFIVITDDDFGNDVMAHKIDIHPGVTKIVIARGGGDNDLVEFSLGDFETDLWRFRLPSSTKPELADAVYVNGELVVTIPKESNSVEEEDDHGEGYGEFRGRVTRFIVVQ
ncbi:hypothetical protein MKW94_004132 [Papaver nudicaule]|uniref:SHSP domain-containing protein n=1 Tax=Papaver nudicaule TaxID=74823 RepID=A0AA41VG53_PAPNU|nr:hypothetical protein [Papaver nudicaule]